MRCNPTSHELSRTDDWDFISHIANNRTVSSCFIISLCLRSFCGLLALRVVPFPLAPLQFVFSVPSILLLKLLESSVKGQKD